MEHLLPACEAVRAAADGGGGTDAPRSYTLSLSLSPSTRSTKRAHALVLHLPAVTHDTRTRAARDRAGWRGARSVPRGRGRMDEGVEEGRGESLQGRWRCESGVITGRKGLITDKNVFKSTSGNYEQDGRKKNRGEAGTWRRRREGVKKLKEI